MTVSVNLPQLASASVNDDAFSTIQSEIVHNQGKAIPQPVLIIGQHGSGKTTLMKRLYRTSAGRNVRWIDGRTIFGTEDITGCANVAWSTEVTGNTILFIDDIDFFFARCSYDEQFKLRHYLYNEGAPMLIGSVSGMLPAFTEYRAPFFEGLKMVYLSPESVERIIPRHFGQNQRRAEGLFRYLPKTIRSLMIVDAIIRLNNSPDEDLPMLLSLFSEKYADKYQDLPAYSQHILNAVGPEDNGLELSVIREKTGLPTNILTAYLKLLQTHGIVAVDKSIKKHAHYMVSDSLFRVWLSRLPVVLHQNIDSDFDTKPLPF